MMFQPYSEIKNYDSESMLRLSQAIRNQPVRIPDNQAWERVLLASRKKPGGVWLGRIQWAAGIALAILLWFAFGAIVQPGVTLTWVAQVDQPSTFLVYRAEVGTNQFLLVAEVPAQAGQVQYTYLDSQYVPGKTYQYQIEGVVTSGAVITSTKVVVGGESLLPVYLFLMGLSVAASYALVVLGGVLFQTNRLATAV